MPSMPTPDSFGEDSGTPRRTPDEGIVTPALPEELSAGDASDLRLLVPRSKTSPDPRFIYTTLDGKLYRFDRWAIRGYDDLGLPFPSEAKS